MAKVKYKHQQTTYEKAEAWIKKKTCCGNPTRKQLKECVGAWSNKSKKRVMAEKKLSSAAYDKRYKFLSKVYELL